jgi:hypothetical protein
MTRSLQPSSRNSRISVTFEVQSRACPGFVCINSTLWLLGGTFVALTGVSYFKFEENSIHMRKSVHGCFGLVAVATKLAPREIGAENVI